MKKICLVDFDMSVTGGVEQVAASLANAFCSCCEVYVFEINHGGGCAYELDDRVGFIEGAKGNTRLREMISATFGSFIRFVKEKKIDVVLKRSSGEQGKIFDDGFLRIDLVRAKAEVNGASCPVTPTEFRILQEFLAHKGQLLTYEVLMDRLWDGGSQFVDRHALAVNINRLRGKIEDREHRYISNVYGMGYQWIGQ